MVARWDEDQLSKDLNNFSKTKEEDKEKIKTLKEGIWKNLLHSFTEACKSNLYKRHSNITRSQLDDMADIFAFSEFEEWLLTDNIKDILQQHFVKWARSRERKGEWS